MSNQLFPQTGEVRKLNDNKLKYSLMLKELVDNSSMVNILCGIYRINWYLLIKIYFQIVILDFKEKEKYKKLNLQYFGDSKFKFTGSPKLLKIFSTDEEDDKSLFIFENILIESPIRKGYYSFSVGGLMIAKQIWTFFIELSKIFHPKKTKEFLDGLMAYYQKMELPDLPEDKNEEEIQLEKLEKTKEEMLMLEKKRLKSKIFLEKEEEVKKEEVKKEEEEEEMKKEEDEKEEKIPIVNMELENSKLDKPLFNPVKKTPIQKGLM